MTIVQILVKAGARVDVVDSIGGTPISYALCYGHEEITNELMRGAQPDSVDKIRRELILSAMKHDHDPVVKRLLDSGADPEAIDDEGVSLIVLATKQGKTNIITLLVERGADINKSDRYGRTPLMSAVEEGKTNIIELLIERGADINKGGRYGRTPLMSAVEKGKTNIIELLVERGADINNSDRYGRTPLMLAVEEGKPNIIELLIERGADINKSDDDGKTPLIFAMQRFIPSIDSHLAAIDSRLAAIDSHMVEMLLKGGVRVDYTYRNIFRTPWGIDLFPHEPTTPLLFAINWSNDKLADLLLIYGADPNFVGGCRFAPREAAKIRRDNLKAELERLEDDTRSGFVRNKRIAQFIQENLASSNAIIRMLEDTNRIR